MTKVRTNFMSKYRRYNVWVDDVKIAQFEPIGYMGNGRKGYGGFSTDDEKIIEKLKALPAFGRDFHCLDGAKFPQFYDTNIRVGAQTSIKPSEDEEKIKANAKAEAELEAAKKFAEIKNKYKRLGELEGKWTKKDGGFRADAPPEEVEEYNKLKQEIGEI